MHSSEVSKGHAGLREFGTPADYLLIGVDGRRVILTNPTMSTRWLAALFVVAILDIIGVVAKPKMGRIYAAAVSYVANWVTFVAAVAHKLTFWNGAIVDFVGKAGCRNGEPPAISRYVQLSVPYMVGAGCPKPTIIGAALVNLFPEAIFIAANRSDFVVMADDEPGRFPFDDSALNVALPGWLSPAAAATVAESWFNFVRGFTRDMIGHGISSFLADVRARNVRETLPGFLIGVGL